ncbi:MAG: hypothetical protein ACRD96_29590, partial [Bryobacteraceae bacterium]
MVKFRLPVVLLLAAALLPARTPAPPYAIVNAKVVVSAEKTLARGIVLLREGRIEAVGESIPIPPDARVYDAKGLVVYPGLIDAATHYGFPVAVRAAAPAVQAAAAPVAAPSPEGTGTAAQPPAPDDVNSPDKYLWPKPAGVNADVVAAARLAIPAEPDARRSLGFTTVL